MGRWWCAVVAGTLVSLPLAWLLSHAALLPVFLGVFFFALFGLVIGAVMHRVAAPGRPYPPAPLLIGTTIVVLVAFTVSLMQEARDAPRKMARSASENVRDIGDRTVPEYMALVSNEIRDRIREAHPPGGLIGYARWVMVDGVFDKGEIQAANLSLRASHRGMWWLGRVAVSAGLLAFGIGSQTLALRLKRDPIVRAVDREPLPGTSHAH